MKTALMHKIISRYSVGVVSILLLTISTWGWAAEINPRLPVVVVGGGISGLTALHELGKAKVPSLLFEERSTLGGRIKAFNTKEGHRLSAGAELIDSDNTQLFSLAKQYGLKILPRFAGPTADYVYNIDGDWIRHDDLMKILFEHDKRALLKISFDQGRMNQEEFVRELDQKSAYDYLIGIHASPHLIQLAQAGAQSEVGRDLQELSATVFFDQFNVDLEGRSIDFLPHHDEAWVLDGGMIRMIEAIEQTHKEQIHKNQKLTHVKEQANGVFELTFEDTETKSLTYITADSVIITIPPYLWNTITWDIKSIQRPTELEHVQYAQNSKIAIFFDRAVWEKGTVLALGSTSKGSFQVWDNPNSETYPPFLTVFTESFSDPKMVSEVFIPEILSELEEMYPGIKQAYIRHEIFDWNHSYTAAERTHERTQVMAFHPLPGRLQYAGEAFEAEFRGYLEGAIRSAQDAVERVVGARTQNDCSKLLEL